MTAFSSPSTQKSPYYNLEERTHRFSDDVRRLGMKIPATLSNIEDLKQLTRSSGSVGANYIEADEALSKKDFVKHLRIARKEAKESMHWLRLLNVQQNRTLGTERNRLVEEAKQLVKIFSASIVTATNARK